MRVPTAVRRGPEKLRGLFLPEGIAEPYVFIHRFRSIELVAQALGCAIEVVDSRYWPLVIGAYPRVSTSEDRRNLLAEALLDVPPGREVYGDAVLLGYDPLIKKYSSITDLAVQSAAEAYAFSQTLRIDVV